METKNPYAFKVFLLCLLSMVVGVSIANNFFLNAPRAFSYTFLSDIQPLVPIEKDEEVYRRPQRQTEPPRCYAGPSPGYVKTSTFRKRLTPRQKELVLQRYNYCCAYCRVLLKQEPFNTEFDHILPLASDAFGTYRESLNSIEQYQPLCRRCHGWKCHMEREAGLYRR